MSNIPKSKRSESKLEVLHRAIKLRKHITLMLRVMYTQAQKRIEKLSSEKELDLDAIRAEKFSLVLIDDECRAVAGICRDLMSHLRNANTIWPTYKAEFEERRLEMDRAMCCCNELQSELQYIAEAVYSDINKFAPLVLDVQEEFNMIKKLRQADNRFLKDIKA